MRLADVFYAAALVVGVASAASAQTPAAITVTSTTLKAGETIPKDHTADGRNVSPALMWSGAPAATKQFAGPAPPPGKPHHYTFTVYALDTELALAEGATKADLVKAMEGHIIGQGSLVSIYERVKQ